MEILDSITAWASKSSSLINLLLMTFIVLLTGWYAVVTRRMWREMVDARLAEIRPIFYVTVDRLDLIESEVHKGERILKSEVEIQNFGRGPAYALRCEVSLRYENTKEKTWIGAKLRTLPVVTPGQNCSCPLSINPFPTSMDESKKNFLVVFVNCQDAEGNYYSLRQSYDLRAFKINEFISRTWQLRSEDVRFTKHRKRHQNFRDVEPEIEHSNMALTAEYQLPRSHDWSNHQ